VPRDVPLPSSKPASLHALQAAVQHGITALALKTDPGAAGSLAAVVDRIELWPIDRLRPYERNPRTHSEAQVTKCLFLAVYALQSLVPTGLEFGSDRTFGCVSTTVGVERDVPQRSR
jgi:hypothetical protein